MLVCVNAMQTQNVQFLYLIIFPFLHVKTKNLNSGIILFTKPPKAYFGTNNSKCKNAFLQLSGLSLIFQVGG